MCSTIMTIHTLQFRIVFMLLSFGFSVHTFEDFPLSDCHTGQFDILVMRTVKFIRERWFIDPTDLTENITSVWTLYGNNNSRVLVSKVSDIWYSYSDGSTCLLEMVKYNGEEIHICDNMTFKLPNNFNNRSVELEIRTKIKVAAYIFTNMGVGRENTTHVAIIVVHEEHFPSLTVEEIRGIPAILQEEHSGMKVVVIVDSSNTQVWPTFLPDTIFASYNYWEHRHIASMSLCNRCQPGWFSMKNEVTNGITSCYKVDFASVKIDHREAVMRCRNQGGNLAAVESSEELKFLRSKLFSKLLSHFKRPRTLHKYSSKVFIGLKRDSTHTAKRFQWALHFQKQNRPVMINHWLPGNPNGGFSRLCGVWRYNIDMAYNISKSTDSYWSLFSDNTPNNSEGWSSVDCGVKLSKVSLCEITVSRYSGNQHVIRREPAKTESFHKAKSRSEFMEFEGNIVSVSAYANNTAFLNCVKDMQESFPMFNCEDDGTSPTFISYSFVCDSIDHCSNRRDEIRCPGSSSDYCSNYVRAGYQTPCDGFKECDNGKDETDCLFGSCSGIHWYGTCLPAHLFNDEEVDCIECKTDDNIVINDESSVSDTAFNRNETCAFICNKNQCVYPSQINDSNSDCYGSEGPLDETLGKLERSNSCYDNLGRLFWAPMCVYIRDRYGSILGCRDLSHLQNCSDFPCQEGYYKCPGSYCIPLHYVLDGRGDCPSGEEEVDRMSSTCIGNFACWNSKVCLHPDLVCDRYPHCPYKDDELNCDVSCSEGLRCIAGTVTVGDKNLLTQLNNLSFIDGRTRFLDLSGIDLSYLIVNESRLYKLYILRISGCKLTNIDSLFEIFFLTADTLYMIDMSYNLITSLTDSTYTEFNLRNLRTLNLSFNERLDDFANQKLQQLETLDLSHTGLLHLSERSFASLPNLKCLNLSFTKITTFQRDIFPPGYTLGILDLRGTPIIKFYENTFNGLRITSSLYATKFGLCCPQIRGDNISEHACHTSENAISSCFDLIDVALQKVFLWLMAGIAILGNLSVILFRLIWDSDILKRAYGLFVLNLGISDLIMGLYLIVITTADVYYRGMYVLHDKDWRESDVCKVAGFFATLSSETSTFFIFLITVDRYLVLKFPYGQHQFSTVTKSIAVILAWAIGFLLALIPVLPIFGPGSVFSSNAMCNGLPLTNDRVNGWGYSFGVFIVLNFAMFLAIALGQIAIFQAISANRISVDLKNQNSVRRAENIIVAKQLSLIVLSNFCCWFPVGFMGFLSLSGHQISNDVYSWTVVLVLPVNSAINPVLYTIPVLTARWKKFKYGNSCSV